jgi:DNA-binding CsgD family transcriptional regulator
MTELAHSRRFETQTTSTVADPIGQPAIVALGWIGEARVLIEALIGSIPAPGAFVCLAEGESPSVHIVRYVDGTRSVVRSDKSLAQTFGLEASPAIGNDFPLALCADDLWPAAIRARVPYLRDHSNQNGLARLLVVFLRDHGHLCGLVGLERRSDERAFSGAEIDEAGRLAPVLLSVMKVTLGRREYGRALAALRALGGVEGTVFVIDRDREQIVWASEPAGPAIESVVVTEAEAALKTDSWPAKRLLPDGRIVSVVPLDDGSMFGGGRYAVVELVQGAAGRGSVSTLSGREREVAQLLADGYSHVNIAARCELAAATVRTYVARIYTKLGVCNRADLVREILRPRGASDRCVQVRTKGKRTVRGSK